jgi:hypothetical protein
MDEANIRHSMGHLPKWSNGKLITYEDGLIPKLEIGKEAKWRLEENTAPTENGSLEAEMLSFASTIEDIDRKRGGGNFLKMQMVISALAGTQSKISELRAKYGARAEFDTEAFYNLYCNRRSPPPLPFLNSVQAVGMAFMRSPTGVRGISYVAFFIPNYGAWLPSVASMPAISSFLGALYRKGIPLVAFDSDAKSSLEVLTQSKLLPTIENIRDDQDIFSVAWSKLGVDMLSWMLRSNRARLKENPPKNPIEYSFRTEWKLRWEQMVYSAVCAMLTLAIATTLGPAMRGHSM